MNWMMFSDDNNTIIDRNINHEILNSYDAEDFSDWEEQDDDPHPLEPEQHHQQQQQYNTTRNEEALLLQGFNATSDAAAAAAAIAADVTPSAALFPFLDTNTNTSNTTTTNYNSHHYPTAPSYTNNTIHQHQHHLNNNSSQRSSIQSGNRVRDSSSNNENNNNTTDNVDVNVLLAHDLNSLSFQQRESLNEEIHGVNVDEIYYETYKHLEDKTRPELLHQALAQLAADVDKLAGASFAYTRCQQLYGDTTYINTDTFRLMFLRRTLFDKRYHTAQLIIEFVELMYEIHGDVGLERRFTLSDFSDEELRYLQSGYSQLLPGRDRAGRRIVFQLNSSTGTLRLLDAKSRIRLTMFILMGLADDIDVQKRGIIFINWFDTDTGVFDDVAARAKAHATVSRCLPLRMGAIHVCMPTIHNNITTTTTNTTRTQHRTSPPAAAAAAATAPRNHNNSAANIIKSMLALSIGGKGRSKLRFHTGSAMECLYTLQTFGIPSTLIPFHFVDDIASSNTKKRRLLRNKKAPTSWTSPYDDTVRTTISSNSSSNNSSSSNRINMENHIKWFKSCQLKDTNMKLYGRKWKFHEDENDPNEHGRDQVGTTNEEHYSQQHQQRSRIIECPTHADILCGRGKSVMKHPGNKSFLNVLASKLSDYMQLTTSEEATKFTWNILYYLKNNCGARFLKEELTETNGLLGCWEELSDAQARLKVRIAFRDKVKKLPPQQQQQQRQQQPPFPPSFPPDRVPTPLEWPTGFDSFLTSDVDLPAVAIGQRSSYSTSDRLMPTNNFDSSTSVFLSMSGRKRERQQTAEPSCFAPRESFSVPTNQNDTNAYTNAYTGDNYNTTHTVDKNNHNGFI